MVTLDLADELRHSARSVGHRGDRAVRRRECRSTTATSSPGRCACVGAAARRAHRQADPPRRRSRRRLGRRRRGAALGRRHRPRRRPRSSAPTSRSASRGGRARVRGIGEVVEPLPFEARVVTLVVPAASRARRRPSTGRGTTSAGPPATPATTSSRRRSPSSRGCAEWRELVGEAAGERPVLAGSGATWFVPTASATTPSPTLRGEGAAVIVPHRSDGRAALDHGRLLATLVAGAAKHLLVLLLAHPLAALLDQRTHEVGHATRYRDRHDGGVDIPGSFNR